MKLKDAYHKSLKYFRILGLMKNDARFKYVSWKNAVYCFISIVWVHVGYKTEKFRF